MTSSNSKYHRALWGTSVRFDEHAWRIRLKNPRGHLMVNTYVWKTPNVLLVIDPGWPFTMDALEEALRELEIANSLSSVDVFLYTHTHIDHMGGAAILHAHDPGPQHIAWGSCSHELCAWHAYQDRMSDWRPWADVAFAEPARSAIMAAMTHNYKTTRKTMVGHYGPADLAGHVTLCDLGDTLSFDGLELEVHDARGHDPMHAAFFERERGWLFAGDVVLAVPTPISQCMDDDLVLYMQSLDRLELLSASTLMPGHGTMVEGIEQVRQSFARSKRFVTTQRDAIMAVFESNPEFMDLYAIALEITPEKKMLSPRTRWVVHLALTDSHVNLLVEENHLERVQTPIGPKYRRLG